MQQIRITLKAARINAGLTIADVSKEMGITQQTMINWERGASEPSVSQARALSALYKIPLDLIIMPERLNKN